MVVHRFFKDRRVQEARIDNYLSKADKNLAEAAVNCRKKGKSTLAGRPGEVFHRSAGAVVALALVSRIVDVGAIRRSREAAISAGMSLLTLLLPHQLLQLLFHLQLLLPLIL